MRDMYSGEQRKSTILHVGTQKTRSPSRNA